jgi:hypothetical protein
MPSDVAIIVIRGEGFITILEYMTKCASVEELKSKN